MKGGKKQLSQSELVPTTEEPVAFLPSETVTCRPGPQRLPPQPIAGGKPELLPAQPSQGEPGAAVGEKDPHEEAVLVP